MRFVYHIDGDLVKTTPRDCFSDEDYKELVENKVLFPDFYSAEEHLNKLLNKYLKSYK